MLTECGRLFRLVLGSDQTKGFVLVAHVKGFLFLGVQVFAVVGAQAALEYPVTLFHLIPHGNEHAATRTKNR